MAAAPVRPRTRAVRLPASVPGRLLRLELRRNAMVWMAPVLLGVFFVTTYRPVMALPALWGLRTLTMQTDALIAFGPFVAGAAAWMGSREGRRDTAEMVAATARPRWSGQLATWAATTCWALATFLLCAAVVYGVTAGQATWGSPELWPALVDAAWIVAFGALGFAAGALVPSRFAAPLAAVITAVALEVAYRMELPSGLHGPLNAAPHLHPYALALPAIGTPLIPFNAGIYYAFLPDVSIVEAILGAGIAAAAIGVLGLRAGGGRRLRAIAMTLVLVGLAASGTAIGLAGTAVPDAHGMIAIPALHDSAEDRPTPYTPACSGGAIPICVHPAFRDDVAGMAQALAPVDGELAGLAGTPVRVELSASAGEVAIRTSTPTQTSHSGSLLLDGLGAGTISGTPPVLRLSFNLAQVHLAGPAFDERVLQSFVGAVVGAGHGDGAQQAIQGALDRDAGITLGQSIAPGRALPPNQFGLPAPARAAATRFSALPAAAQRAWLSRHWAALRAGEVALAQIP